MGSRVPQTLLAWVITTARVRGVRQPSRASVRSAPVSSQGTRVKVQPTAASWVRGRMTALCSMEDTRTWSPGFKKPFNSTFRLSVTFLVNTTLRQSGPWNRSHSSCRVSNTVSSTW